MIGKLAALGIGSFATCAVVTTFAPQLIGQGVGFAQQGWDVLSKNALMLGAGGSIAGAAVLAVARSAYGRLKQGASEAISTAQNQAFEFNQAAVSKIKEATDAKEAAEKKAADLQTQLNQTANIRTELETLKKENQRIMDEYNALMRIQAIKENLPETRPTVG